MPTYFIASGIIQSIRENYQMLKKSLAKMRRNCIQTGRSREEAALKRKRGVVAPSNRSLGLYV